MFYRYKEVVFRNRTIRYITPELDEPVDPLIEILRQTKKENEGMIVVIKIPGMYTSGLITDNKTSEDIAFWESYTKLHSPDEDCLGSWTRATY